MEKQLIEEQNIPYYGISSGKLRRYKDLRNLTDPFRVIKGYAQSVSLLRKIKPDVVFSKVDSFPFLSFSQRNASVFLLLFMNPI